MFERAEEAVRRQAERRAEARVLQLTQEMRETLPRGIEAEARPEGVALSGPGLKQRFMTEAALRWMRLS